MLGDLDVDTDGFLVKSPDWGQNETLLVVGDPRVVLGTVRSEQVPGNEPNDSRNARDVEGQRPAVVQLQLAQKTRQGQHDNGAELHSCVDGGMCGIHRSASWKATVNKTKRKTCVDESANGGALGRRHPAGQQDVHGRQSDSLQKWNGSTALPIVSLWRTIAISANLGDTSQDTDDDEQIDAGARRHRTEQCE